MKKLLLGLSSILLLSIFLAACQGTGEEATKEEVHTDEEHDHSEGEETNQEAPEKITIEGIADHYHTGDTIKLTAVLEEETESDHWHWYSRESSDGEWVAISGQETDTFTGEATKDGIEIKVVLYGSDDKPEFQSAPVKVVIDDHHGHDEESKQIYNGDFEDSQVKERELSDWEGDWQSVYPYLLSGDLDEVFAHKAESGDMTEEEYKEYYKVGYETNVNRITIENNVVTFFEDGKEYSGEYASDGYEILTYEKGNRGVRYIFKLVDGSEEAPQYIQFSDHNIFPVDSNHYHLYWGDDREALLEEVTNWPTYYPSNLDAEDLVRDMLAH
ncbi:ZinT family metal-binding protein [Ureibacillus sp. FSL E2-3493]|uniref:ZinT family metal-binding protein n=1 Tax=Ureibacillus sp. FSL E2-3493 TaxID=2921367 RepID=UPI00311A3271